MIRKSIYAGRFYPRSHEVVCSRLLHWTGSLLRDPPTQRTIALVVPHAGYMYSGAVAARAFHGFGNEKVDTFIILHPSHHTSGFDYSVSPFSRYEGPFSHLRMDEECFRFFIQGREEESTRMRYHEMEHSMEVLLPMINLYFPGTKVCPLMLGSQSYQGSMDLAQKIDTLMRQSSQRIVTVVSTDLSHYNHARKAVAMDGLLIQKMKDGEIEELWKLACDSVVEGCGIGGILSVMALNKAWPGSKLEILEYTHSGETSGDNSRVVGYLSARLYLEEE